MSKLRSHQLDASDAAAHQGLVKDPTTGFYLPADVVLGLTSTDGSVTITPNGDGKLNLSAAGGGGGGGGEPYSILDYVNPGETLVDDGSSVGNNTVIVQRAVDALNTLYVADGLPRQIHFPDGKYKLAQAGTLDGKPYAVQWRSGVGIATSSRRGVVFLADATSTPFYAAYSVGGVTQVHCDPHVVDGAAQTNATYTTALKGWFLQDVSDSSWTDVLVRNCFATGFGCDFLVRVKVTGHAENNGRGLAATGTAPLTASGGSGFGIGTGKYAVEDFTFDVTTKGNGFHGLFTETQTSATYPFSKGGRVRLKSQGDYVGFRDCGCDGLVADVVAVGNGYAGVLHDKTVLAPHAGINGVVRVEVRESAGDGIVLGDCNQGGYRFTGSSHHNTGDGVSAAGTAVLGARLRFSDLDLHDNGGDGLTLSASTTGLLVDGVRAWSNTGDSVALRDAAKTATDLTILACDLDSTAVLAQTLAGTPMIHGNRGLTDNPASGGSTTTYREVLMASGTAFPAEPLESSSGGDWLNGEV